MAIAGFCCNDGLVIAADTEETYPDNKVYSHKLFPVKDKHWHIGVAGSGIGYLIDYVKDKIVAALHSGTIKSTDEFEPALARMLYDVYDNEFQHFPVNSRSELQMQLLVGIQFAKQADASAWMDPALFECQSNLVTRVGYGARILGAGELLKETATQLAGWGLDSNLAEWASIYIIHEAKKRLTGVGGKTHTLRITNSGEFIRHRDFAHKEIILDSLTRVNQLPLLSLSPSLTEDKFKDLVDAGKDWLESARCHLQKVERNHAKGKHNFVVINSREVQRMMRQLSNASSGRKKPDES